MVTFKFIPDLLIQSTKSNKIKKGKRTGGKTGNYTYQYNLHKAGVWLYNINKFIWIWWNC